MTTYGYNVKPLTMKILLSAAALFLAFDALDKFNIVNLTGYLNPLLIPFIVSLGLLSEVGFRHMIKNYKSLGIVDSITVLLAVLSLVGVVLLLFQVESSILTTMQGIISGGLGVFSIIQIFKK